VVRLELCRERSQGRRFYGARLFRKGWPRRRVLGVELQITESGSAFLFLMARVRQIVIRLK
jgi:hypothetical protein